MSEWSNRMFLQQTQIWFCVPFVSLSSSWLKWTAIADVNQCTGENSRMVAKDPVALVRRFQKNVAYWELQEMAKGYWFQPDMIDRRWNTLSKLQNDFQTIWVWLEIADFQPSESTIKPWGWLWIDFMCLRFIVSPTAPEWFPVISRFSGASRKNVPAKAREKKKTSKINYKMR